MKAHRVLILEDDAVIAALLAELLVSMGHSVCATEATEADGIAAAVRCRPDLIIADIWLREGNGVSAMATILRFSPVPHIVVSADVRKLKDRMAHGVILQKPFLEASLADAIRRASDVTAALKPSSTDP